jgi:hypothetical protein
MSDQSYEDVLVEQVDIGRDPMASDGEIASMSATDWPQVRSGPLVVGGILIGLGAMAAIAGVAVAGKHLIEATRVWVNEMETPPDQFARLRWEQAKAAASAGATAWRGHPNAKVHLVRSGNSVS